MSRRLTFTRLAAVVVVGSVLAASGGSALGQEKPASGPPRQPDPAGQSDNEKLRELARPGLRWGVLSEKDLVAPGEREALGLEDTSWTKQHGKVHPDVYKSLDKAERVTEPWLDVSGHTGTVYVQVQLKYEQRGETDSAEDKGAIKQVQSKVLSQLTAAEFYSEYTFERLPAILGYATRGAIEKLKASPDVLAVCLDEKPFPQRAGRVAADDLPPAAQSDRAARAAHSVVEADVYRALEVHGRVFVIVPLKHTAVERGREPQLYTGRSIEERLLSSLTADQLWVVWRSPLGSGRPPEVKGLVNIAGLGVLERHPLVEAVMLDQRLHLDPEPVRK